MANEKTVTISISGVPKTLLTRVDKLADNEHRDRSGQIVKILEDIVREKSARTKRKAA